MARLLLVGQKCVLPLDPWSVQAVRHCLVWGVSLWLLLPVTACPVLLMALTHWPVLSHQSLLLEQHQTVLLSVSLQPALPVAHCLLLLVSHEPALQVAHCALLLASHEPALQVAHCPLLLVSHLPVQLLGHWLLLLTGHCHETAHSQVMDGVQACEQQH